MDSHGAVFGSPCVAAADLAVGVEFDAGSGDHRGAVWVLFLDGICPWDLDANGSVSILDLLTLLANWGPCA